MEKINLADKFALIQDHWNPRIVGAVNETHIKLVKLQGEFIWHHHEQEDEMFLVLEGSLLMQFRDGDVTINAGEFIIVPKGVEHRPVAALEVSLMLIEPTSTVNTGNIQNERTVNPTEI